jgi:hypothetical protein
MSDDDSKIRPGAAEDPDILLYDYFKWLTTISLLTLGGVLSLSQSANVKLRTFEIAMMLLPLCIAAVCALSGANAIVKAKALGKPGRLAPVRFLSLTMFMLGIGTGAFLLGFWETLK